MFLAGGVGDVLDGIQSVVVSLAAGTAAWMAVLGVNAWRKQMRGKTEYEIARRCLRQTYRIRDSLRFVRSPMISSGEFAHAAKEQEDKPTTKPAERSKQDKMIAVYNERWRHVAEAHSDLMLDVLEAEVLWPKIRAASKPLSECIHDLNVDLSFYLREISGNRPRLSIERREALDKAIFWQGPDDPFEVKLRDAVQKMEDLLAPHVRA